MASYTYTTTQDISKTVVEYFNEAKLMEFLFYHNKDHKVGVLQKFVDPKGSAGSPVHNS